MFGTLIGYLCVAACSGALTISGASAPYDPASTHPVFFYGTQVGVYLDDTQPGQCADAVVERERWRLVIAGNAPGGWPQDECPAATVNALEWGRYWGPPPSAPAYILESATLAPLFSWPPALTWQAMRASPVMVLLYGQPNPF